MILRQGEDTLITRLMTQFVINSPQTLVVTEDSFPLSVPTNLLRMISPTLTTLLSLPPCLSTSLILPDTNTKTLSALLDLLRTGTSSQKVSSESVEDLAKTLGIRGFSLPGLDSTERIIKSEEEDEQSYSCDICPSAFNSRLPLGVHYCKHFYTELQSLDLSGIVKGLTCIKCDKTFPNHKAVLSHVGVRHNLLNMILRSKGLKEIELESSVVGKSRGPEEKPDIELESSTKGRLEKSPAIGDADGLAETDDRVCGICSEDFSETSLSSLVIHYCNHFSDQLPLYFSKFYSDNTCIICNKVFQVESSLLSHIGVRHTKINIVLRAFNLAPIHFPKKQLILRSKVTSSNLDENDENMRKNEITMNTKLESIKNIKFEDTKNIKFSRFHCLVCGKGDDLLTNLGIHMGAIHFNEDLKEFIGPEHSCRICGKTSKTKQLAIGHIGISHGKLDDALEKKGYATFSSLKSIAKLNKKNSDYSMNKSIKKRRIPKKCQLCGKEEESVSMLKIHMVLKHYLTVLKTRYKSLYENRRCVLCCKSYPATSIWQHIGAVHNKLDEILIQNGLRPFQSSTLTSITEEMFVTDHRSQEMLETDHRPQEMLVTDHRSEEVLVTDHSSEEVLVTDHTPMEETVLGADYSDLERSVAETGIFVEMLE